MYDSRCRNFIFLIQVGESDPLYCFLLLDICTSHTSQGSCNILCPSLIGTPDVPFPYKGRTTKRQLKTTLSKRLLGLQLIGIYATIMYLEYLLLAFTGIHNVMLLKTVNDLCRQITYAFFWKALQFLWSLLIFMSVFKS